MIWGKIYISIAGGSVIAELGPDGWKCPELPVYADILNNACIPSQYSPSEGDPVVRALNDAASLFDGRADIYLPRVQDPLGMIY